jgi:antitoxin component YwqK of YwqJK toxin-antitoxin module
MIRSFTCCVILFLLLPLGLMGQPAARKGFWPFKINRYDREGRHHGRWKVYLPDNTTLIRDGRYKHGKERGTWRYYAADGKLRKKEFHKPKADRFLVKIYHDNGQLEKQGWARVVETEELIHYYWFGAWQVYDRQGRFSHTEYYVKGNEISLRLAER